MSVGLSTAFAGGLPRGDVIGQILETFARAGVAGVMLDASLPGGLYEELARRLLARRDELPVWALENPCPQTKAEAADLAAVERDEAHAAAEAAEETIGRAEEIGAEVVALRLGEVASLKSDWPAIRRQFLQAKLDEKSCERLVRERAKRVQPHLDAARRALDRLSRRAEAAGVRLGVRNAPRPIGLPSATELAQLLQELAGAPIVPLFDLAAAHVSDAMGLDPLAGVVEGWTASPLALIGDACLGVMGLPPSRGEIDVRAALAGLNQGAHAIFHPWAGLTIQEVFFAMEELRRIPGPRRD